MAETVEQIFAIIAPHLPNFARNCWLHFTDAPPDCRDPDVGNHGCHAFENPNKTLVFSKISEKSGRVSLTMIAVHLIGALQIFRPQAWHKAAIFS